MRECIEYGEQGSFMMSGRWKKNVASKAQAEPHWQHTVIIPCHFFFIRIHWYSHERNNNQPRTSNTQKSIVHMQPHSNEQSLLKPNLNSHHTELVNVPRFEAQHSADKIFKFQSPSRESEVQSFPSVLSQQTRKSRHSFSESDPFPLLHVCRTAFPCGRVPFVRKLPCKNGQRRESRKYSQARSQIHQSK